MNHKSNDALHQRTHLRPCVGLTMWTLNTGSQTNQLSSRCHRGSSVVWITIINSQLFMVFMMVTKKSSEQRCVILELLVSTQYWLTTEPVLPTPVPILSNYKVSSCRGEASSKLKNGLKAFLIFTAFNGHKWHQPYHLNCTNNIE